MNPNAAVFRPTTTIQPSKPIETNSSHLNHAPTSKHINHHKSTPTNTSPSQNTRNHTQRHTRNRQNVQNSQPVRINQNIPSRHTLNNSSNNTQQNTTHIQNNNTTIQQVANNIKSATTTTTINNNINNNITNITNTNKNNTTMSLPVPPLFNSANLAQWQQAQQTATHSTSPHNTLLTPNSTTLSPQLSNSNNVTANNDMGMNNFQFNMNTNLQNQQLIYNQMQQLTQQRQSLQMHITNILQPQLSELSDQMQAALFNCNHVTQPEYYAGLQNQHLILTQTMKDTQSQLNTITYQYQWYQQLLLQYQQQHAQAAQQVQVQAAIQQQQQQNTVINNMNMNNNINNSQTLSQNQTQTQTQILTPTQTQMQSQMHSQAHAQAQAQVQAHLQQLASPINNEGSNTKEIQASNNNNILTSPNQNRFNFGQLYDTNNIFTFGETNNAFNNRENNDAFNNKAIERMPNKYVSNNGVTAVNGNKGGTTNGKTKVYSKQDIFERKLCVLICKLTPDRFDKVLAKMLEFMDNHVQTQNELKIIVDKILKFTLNQPHISSLTAKLFLHFYDYLPRLIMTQQYQQHLWDTNDIAISLTFRKILIVALEKLFSEFLDSIDQNITKNEDNENPEIERIKTDFFGLMEIIGEIYNIDLIHVRVLRKGIFDSLLPPKVENFNIIHIEGLCVLFKSCGKKLDLREPRFVDKYINKMNTLSSAELFGTMADKLEAQNIILELKAIKSNNWVIHRKLGHNQKYKTINWTSIPLDEIREEKEEIISEEGGDDFKDEEGMNSKSSSPKTKSFENIFKVHRDRRNNNTYYTLTKCYGFNEKYNKLTPIKTPFGFIKCMEFGYEGSSYTLGDDGALIVSGNNEFGQLGIENEIITIILKKWDTTSKGIYRIRDISYLITSFVDNIKYKYDHMILDKRDSMLICNDILDDGQLISRGIASRHRFILTTNDQLYGAGCNTFNQIGIDINRFDNESKNNITEISHTKTKNYWDKIDYFCEHNIKLSQIECGYSSSTFLSEDGCLYTVGYSSFGNLGLGDKQNKITKITKIFTIKTKIQHISCGFDHTLCINEYRYVLSFGDNGFGQLGHGHLIQNRRQKPKEIEYFHKNNIHAIEICCGAFHSVVLDCNGKIYCFGYNLGYQCHYNNDDEDLNICIPKMNNTLHNIDKVTNIKCGAFHNIVETQQNQWYLWGDNRHKQCLIYDNKLQYIKIPTKYHQRDIAKNESIIDMFPGYQQTIIFTLQNSMNSIQQN